MKQQTALAKVLGVADGTMLLIGITIGAGIFSTPQLIATYQSSFSDILLLWVGVGVLVGIGGMIYAELGTRLPHTGGEYVYITKAFGPFSGFMFGWAQLLIIRTSSCAGLSLIAASYLAYFFPMSHTLQVAVSIVIILLLGLLNYVGVERASIFQRGSTWLKIIGLAFLIVLGLYGLTLYEPQLGGASPATKPLGPVGNTVAALMLVVFSHTGWDRVGYVAGEMKDPKRAIPKSLFWGLATVILLYWGVNWMYHSTLGLEGVRNSAAVASESASMVMGTAGAAFVALLVIISASGSINGTMMAAPRVYYAMAREGLFFRFFDYVHPKFRSPSRAILMQTGWAIVILLLRSSFENIVAGMVFAILIFYTLTTLALFKFRKEKLGEDGAYKMPGYPILPIIYLIGIVALLVLRGIYEWEKSLTDIAFVISGLPFAWYFTRKKNQP